MTIIVKIKVYDINHRLDCKTGRMEEWKNGRME
jgi:hypothetical protein